ncbi:MAG: hypothetical protein NVSMB53_10040 [Gemmatimonadaceae bacterium]
MVIERISFSARRCGLSAALFLLITVALPGAAHSQVIADTLERPSPSTTMLESTAGAVVGGFLGIIAAIRPGCGSFVRTGHCRVPTMATGFGVGTLVGTVAGALYSTKSGRCGWLERVFRATAGTLVGFGASVPIVGATHGYLRIGVAPMVPVAGAAGATFALKQCAGF